MMLLLLWGSVSSFLPDLRVVVVVPPLRGRRPGRLLLVLVALGRGDGLIVLHLPASLRGLAGSVRTGTGDRDRGPGRERKQPLVGSTRHKNKPGQSGGRYLALGLSAAFSGDTLLEGLWWWAACAWAWFWFWFSGL